MKKNKSRNLTMVALWLLIIVMIVGVILFFVHNNPNSERWSIGYWAFIISIFSAVFSGLNVLVFYQLTMAVENQNDKRQQENAYYEGLKYKLEQQKRMQEKVEDMFRRYISFSFSGEECTTIQDASKVETQCNQDIMTLRLLLQSSELFPSVSPDDVTDVLAVIERLQQGMKHNNAQIIMTPSDTSDTVEEIIKRFRTLVQNICRKEIGTIEMVGNAVMEGITDDIQQTLVESLRLPKSESVQMSKTKRNEVAQARQMGKLLTEQLADGPVSVPYDLIDDITFVTMEDEKMEELYHIPVIVK